MVGDNLSPNTQPKPGSVKIFNCPSCGAGVTIRAIGQTVNAVCGSCSALIDASNENFRLIQEAINNTKVNPMIPLGQRGKIRGTLWEVIGFLQRSDGTGTYVWSEYLLFNPMKGFRWLTEFDGHWNYIISVKTAPEKDFKGNKQYVKYMNKDYTLFHCGKAKIVYVIGEFYWQISVAETVEVQDYILPPEIVSCEKSADEVIWSVGEYLPAEEIKTAFPLAGVLPFQIGVAPNQPSPAGDSSEYYKKWALRFIGILSVLQIFLAFSSKNELVYSGDFTYSNLDKEKTNVTPQFELSDRSQNLLVSLAAPVENNWLEIQADLVSDDTGEVDEFEEGVEYYSGYDSDGHWTEGSKVSHETLSSVGRGKYHLNFEIASSVPSTNFPVSIKVTRKILTWSNYLWALFLIGIFPLIVWLRSRSFEVKRWSQSDFSPYFSAQEDE